MLYYTIQQGLLLLQILLTGYTLYVLILARQLSTRRAIVTMAIFALAFGDYGYISWLMPSPQTKDLISSNFFWFGVRNALSMLYWERWVQHVIKMVKMA